MLDNNPNTKDIAAAGNELYQLHREGVIRRYIHRPCRGDSCTGWEMLDRNPNTKAIVAAGNELYQLHNGGVIWRYTGRSCLFGNCPGWEMLDNNPNTKDIVAAGDELYQLHRGGAIWRYTGTPCVGGSCRSWEMLGNSPNIRAIEAAGGELYRLHFGGEVSRYTGTPCADGSCPSWETLSINPQTINIAGALRPANECTTDVARPPFTLIGDPTASSRATRSGDLFADSVANYQDDRRYDSSIGFTHFNEEPRVTEVTALPILITGQVKIEGFNGYAQAGVALRLVVQTQSGTHLCSDEQLLGELESAAQIDPLTLDTPRALTCNAGIIDGNFESHVFLRTWASATAPGWIPFPLVGGLISTAKAHVKVNRFSVKHCFAN